MPDSIQFPQFRKYKNNKHFFKIINSEEFEEISFIGKKKLVVRHKAKILPDRNFMYDLLNDTPNTAEVIQAQEYEYQLNNG